MVLLSAKNIRLNRPSKKLDHRFLGPFRVVKPIGKQAYELELPERYSKLHPVFHVSLLEPWRGREGEETFHDRTSLAPRYQARGSRS